MLNDELHENWVQWLNKLTLLVHAFICCKWCFFFFHTSRCPTSAFTMLTARVHVDVCICVCVCDHGRVLYGSNYWQWGSSDTHSASHYGPNGMYLPPPFFFLSLLPCLFLLPLSFCTSFSFLFSLTGLNYFRMSPNKRARWNPFLFLLFLFLFIYFYWEQFLPTALPATIF